MTDLCLPTTQFDTADQPNPIELWRDRLSVYDISVPIEERDHFRSAYRGWSLGSVAITAGVMTAQVFKRDAAKIRRDQLDQFGLFTQGFGSRISQTEGQEEVIRPGDLQFFDLAQEEITIATAGTSGSMMLPRELVEAEIPHAAQFHGAVFRDGTARILAQYILSIGANIDQAPLSTLPAIATTSVDLALSCLKSSLRGDESLAGVAFHEAMRRKVERFIDQRLGDSNLGVEQIQEELGMSRSAVYRLFESSHGVARYIKSRRLTRIRAILLENRDPRTLSALAADFGFQSSAHFSREYHRQFGCSPSETRAGRSSQGAPAGNDGTLRALYRSIQA